MFLYNGGNRSESKTTSMFRPVRQVAASGAKSAPDGLHFIKSATASSRAFMSSCVTVYVSFTLRVFLRYHVSVSQRPLQLTEMGFRLRKFSAWLLFIYSFKFRSAFQPRSAISTVAEILFSSSP